MHSGRVPKTKSTLEFIMGFLRIGLLFAICISIITPAKSHAFYQINSEVLNIPNIEGSQGDLKLLAGKDFFTSSRAAIGFHSYYMSNKDPSYYLRYGPMLQLRSKLFIDNLFLYYEHHEYIFKTSFSEATKISSSRFKSENRYGFVYSRYDLLNENLILDSYLETFLIPQVSESAWLSVIRSSLLYKTEIVNPLVEIYIKDSPLNFGGDRNEFRLGFQWQPALFLSLKVMSNILPKTETSSSGLLGQINIFYESSL